MTISALTIKLFGKKNTLYRVMRDGEVVHVAETHAEAAAWIAGQ